MTTGLHVVLSRLTDQPLAKADDMRLRFIDRHIGIAKSDAFLERHIGQSDGLKPYLPF